MLRCLLHLAPELSLELLLQRAVHTLETLTDAHQPTALEMLTRAAHALITVRNS